MIEIEETIDRLVEQGDDWDLSDVEPGSGPPSADDEMDVIQDFMNGFIGSIRDHIEISETPHGYAMTYKPVPPLGSDMLVGNAEAIRIGLMHLSFSVRYSLRPEGFVAFSIIPE